MELRACATCLVALSFLPRLIHVRGVTPRSKIHVGRATGKAKAGENVINGIPTAKHGGNQNQNQNQGGGRK